MKLLRLCSLGILAACLSASAYTHELSSTNVKNHNDKISAYGVNINNINNLKNLKFTPNNGGQILGSVVQFRILDSLLNAYSYYTSDQNPFVYDPTSNTLATIKRGFDEKDAKYSKYSKDNLFLLTSNDLGQTWSEQKLIYDASVDEPQLAARYPSVHVFFDNSNKLSAAFTAPVTDGSGFKGFMNGGYFSGSTYSKYMENFDVNSNTYTFGTGSHIVAGMNNGQPFAVATSMVGCSAVSGDNCLMNRSTTDFDSWTPDIPAGWAYDQFNVSSQYLMFTDVNTRITTNNNYIYASALYQLPGEEDAMYRVPGVSISKDFGKTWSNFVDNTLPYETLDSYFTNTLGVDATQSCIHYNDHDFVAFSNGDFYFIVKTILTTTSGQKYVHLDEVYNESGNWGIRPIVNKYFVGSPIYYVKSNDGGTSDGITKDTNISQMSLELQLAKTADEKQLMIKWLDYKLDIDEDGNATADTMHTDIWIAKRDIGNDSWDSPVNVTKGNEFMHRITWIPDILPNNLVNVPILKVETKPQSSDQDLDSLYFNQVRLEQLPQYVKIANFTYDDLISGINDNNNTATANNLDVSIYPNPTTAEAHVGFNLNNSAFVKIELFNSLGQKVEDVNNGLLNSGYRDIKINTDNLTSGVYYCTVTLDNQTITKSLNVIK